MAGGFRRQVTHRGRFDRGLPDCGVIANPKAKLLDQGSLAG